MKKLLKVYGIHVGSADGFEGELDPEQLTPSQLKYLGIKDLDTPLSCGGTFRIVNTSEYGRLVQVETLIIDGIQGMGRGPFLDILDNQPTFDHIAMIIQAIMDNSGEIVDDEDYDYDHDSDK
jgi:hypothetical protein